MVQKSEIAWCPGCGNFAVRDALENALHELPIPIKDIVLTSGIGQAAKMPHYLDCNFFNGLHGRSLPLAVGIKLARPELTVIAYSGDGCHYGEGGNHFIHTLRRRLDITILVSDNQLYALTKGQSSPTTDPDVVNSLDPAGNHNIPLKPLLLALAVGAPFVARGFAGDQDHLKELIKQAILFKGTAVVDILQPCVSFNKINTFAWYSKRVFPLDKPVTDLYEAMKTASLWGDRIPIGTIYRNDKAECRTGKQVFRDQVTMENILSQISLPCLMMR
ncbi:MAG: thiamine pyrophosphate-dependent enzyme [Syntrophales bacterium]|nr:thiamine pyrophosphate-dependent enzyme [Syntrophales bacterium]